MSILSNEEIEQLIDLKTAVKHAIKKGKMYYESSPNRGNQTELLTDFRLAKNVVNELNPTVGYFMNNCTYLYLSDYKGVPLAGLTMCYGLIRQATFVDFSQVD